MGALGSSIRVAIQSKSPNGWLELPVVASSFQQLFQFGCQWLSSSCQPSLSMAVKQLSTIQGGPWNRLGVHHLNYSPLGTKAALEKEDVRTDEPVVPRQGGA